MTLKFNELLAVVYADLFGWVLTAKEAGLWRIEFPGLPVGKAGIGYRSGYVFLKGKEKLIVVRQRREKIAAQKIEKAKKAITFLSKIPSIQAIFLTGSLAVNNAKNDADADLMIITSHQALWVTRLVVFVFLRLLNLIRQNSDYTDKICPNIFIDEKYLGIRNQNLYTAHEVAQAKCIFDRNHFTSRWLNANSWIKDYLPKINNKPITNNQYPISSRPIIQLLNIILFFIQYLYMKPKITNEGVGLYQAFFHPSNLSEQVLKKFNQKLSKLGIMAK